MTPRSRRAAAFPNDQTAAELCAAIKTLGDYAHVTVRSRHGLLYVYADDPEHPVARLQPLSDTTYGLSFHHHSGRWEPMPFSGDRKSVV